MRRELRSSDFRCYRKKVMKLLSVEISCFLATEEEKSEIESDLLNLLAFRFVSGQTQVVFSMDYISSKMVQSFCNMDMVEFVRRLKKQNHSYSVIT
ncbi:hypothetical protein Bca101_061172 [Brassica carinata]